jgi:hypothetical protein
MMDRNEVYLAIDGERDYQDRKWGTIEERGKQVGSWLTLMRHCLTKAESDWATTRGDADALDEIRKVVAVGVACMEQHGAVPRSAEYTEPVVFSSTNNYGTGPDHEDDVYTVEEFRAKCASKMFVDSDGYGHPVKDSKSDVNIYVCPSKRDRIPRDATHVVWFNK